MTIGVMLLLWQFGQLEAVNFWWVMAGLLFTELGLHGLAKSFREKSAT